MICCIVNAPRLSLLPSEQPLEFLVHFISKSLALFASFSLVLLFLTLEHVPSEC